ncbi:MAG TPA: hypothetical protein VMV03_15295 [Spirochaetia bacterium]|nr:hypothetical protein [Spirochaetia bacterium]
MTKIRSIIPFKMLIAAVVLLALYPAARPVIEALATKEAASSNVLLIAIPFLLIFVAIILGYMSVIVVVAKILANRVPERVHRNIEYVFMAGIVLGIIGMFQPWVFALFKVSFLVLLASTFGFILWSHVAMKRAARGSGREAET